MNKYTYLFKYIIIGDASTHFIQSRCRQIMSASPVSRIQVQNLKLNHSRGRVRLQNLWSQQWQNQTSSLGHCNFLFIKRQASKLSSPSPVLTTEALSAPFSFTISPARNPLKTLKNGWMKPRVSQMKNSQSSSWAIKTTSKKSNSILTQTQNYVRLRQKVRWRTQHAFYRMLSQKLWTYWIHFY